MISDLNEVDNTYRNRLEYNEDTYEGVISMLKSKKIFDKKIYVIGIVFVLALFLFVVMKTEFLSLIFLGENEGGRLVIARHSDSISFRSGNSNRF